MTLGQILFCIVGILISLVIPPIVFLLIGYFVWGYMLPTVADWLWRKAPKARALTKR
jgi:hypothetical protein